jgi:hypothetical protein
MRDRLLTKEEKVHVRRLLARAGWRSDGKGRWTKQDISGTRLLYGTLKYDSDADVVYRALGFHRMVSSRGRR